MVQGGDLARRNTQGVPSWAAATPCLPCSECIRGVTVSAPIYVETVVGNDGDRIILAVDTASKILQQATYTTLNRIDPLELFAVHYVRNEDTGEILKQFKGHSSLLGVQFFLDLFVHKGEAPATRWKEGAKRFLWKTTEGILVPFSDSSFRTRARYSRCNHPTYSLQEASYHH